MKMDAVIRDEGMNAPDQSSLLDILVVDDTAANLNLLTSLLKEAGYGVRAAPLPELALKSALARPPGLALLDIRMPGMDGFELCQRLKQDERTAGVPVIFISALQELNDRVRGFEVGGVDFITKPFQREEVLLRVSAQLELKTLRDGLEKRVKERTGELEQLNKALTLEVADRKSAEAALSISEERYRLTVNAGKIGSWDWDIKANNVHCSDLIEPMLGHKHEHSGTTYETFLDSVHPEDRTIFKDSIATALKVGEKHNTIRYRIVWSDETVHWIDATADVIRNEQGEAVRMLGVMQDVTELVKSEKALEHSHEQLRSLIEYMHEVREEEQKRIARDIHDDLGQLLTAIHINISSIEEMLAEEKESLQVRAEEASMLVSTAITKVQQIAAGLRPMLLDDLGIIAAIQWQINGFQNRTGIRCSFDSNVEIIEVHSKLATEVFRISQEALTNISRHAEATNAEISLDKEDGIVILKIKDNGRGVSEEEVNDARSIGFIGIRERAYSVKGDVEISGRAGEGTSIIATFPTGEEP